VFPGDCRSQLSIEGNAAIESFPDVLRMLGQVHGQKPYSVSLDVNGLVDLCAVIGHNEEQYAFGLVCMETGSGLRHKVGVELITSIRT
jgi:hypothetical protein